MHRMPRFLFRPMTAIMIVILNSASLDSQNLVYFASRRSVYVSAYREIRHYLEKSIHFFFFFLSVPTVGRNTRCGSPFH